MSAFDVPFTVVEVDAEFERVMTGDILDEECGIISRRIKFIERSSCAKN